MSRFIEIVEVGPRDGLQNEKTLLGIDQKLEMIRRLEAAGARRMEVVSFVNPKRVPQMAGAEEIMAALPREKGRSRIGLVLNMKGWERCLAAECDEANVVVCATDGFGIRNQGASVDEQITTLANIMGVRRKEDPPVSMTVSVAFGCPFDGEVPEERVVEIVKAAADMRVAEIALAAALALGILGHGALAALLAPRLDPLWVSARLEAALESARLLPRQGVTEAPVAVAGYAEPSLVFALGTGTGLGGPAEAAQAVVENRPAIVEQAEEAAFRDALDARGGQAYEVAVVKGINYSKGDPMTLRVYMAPIRELQP